MKKLIIYMALMVFALSACQPSGDDVVLELADGTTGPVKFDKERQTARVKFNCNRSWKATSSDEWIEIDNGKGSAGDGQVLKFYLSPNPGYLYRTGTITFNAGGTVMDLQVIQEPEIVYLVNEIFNTKDLIVESPLPDSWISIDSDGDGFEWRCWRDPETGETFAFSASYYDVLGKTLSPDNVMLTPTFKIPAKGFSLRWDVRGNDPEYLGDKYQVWIAAIVDNTVQLGIKVCEEETTSATTLTHHEVSLEDYDGATFCIAFRHCESTDLARVLITNVEVSNRQE